MGNAPQTGLDRTNDHVAAGKSLAATLGIDRHRPVGPFVRLAVRCVSVIGANLAVSRVAIDHRVHIAGGHPVKQIGFAELFEVDRRIPVWLANDADAKPLRLKQATNQGHAETWVIDVGIAGHQNNVAGIPA